MTLDDDTCYRALAARDGRFDGLFFVGVKTTGIYCRPICTAKAPRRSSCRFFANAALAEQAGFRPCLRCRPELAPGLAPVDATGRVAQQAMQRIAAGALNGSGDLERLAEELGLSSRQVRRVVLQQYGVTPIVLAQTSRLLLAKQLLTETTLPMIRVTTASGFDSVRRFNAAIRDHYHLTPLKIRGAYRKPGDDDCVHLTMMYRPPLAWLALLRFLADRAIRGVEAVTDETYARSVAIDKHVGWLRVRAVAERPSLRVELATSLLPVLPTVLSRLRHLFDLDARPDVIADHLGTDRLLVKLMRRNPGLRVPGAFDGFELLIRAILGQQISVAAATTLTGRIAKTFGEAIETPVPEVERHFPTPTRLLEAGVTGLRKLGIIRARAECLIGVAEATASGALCLCPGSEPDGAMRRLQECAGIGPWTAQYVAMRALRWPDAFPESDLGLRRALGMMPARQLKTRAEAWRPWRAYAAMTLWQS